MAKQTHFLKQGFAQIKLGERQTLTFNPPVTKSVVITISPATDDEPVRRSQQKLARMWAADMAKAGKGQLNLSELCYGWFKGRYLPRYITDMQLADRFQAIKYQMASDPVHFAVICDALLSTSMFTCSEVSEALRDWQKFMNEHDIHYRDPSDYKAALQVEAYT